MTQAFQIASSIGWAIHEPALQTILEIADRAEVNLDNLDQWKAGEHDVETLAPESVAGKVGPRLEGTARVWVRDGIAVVPVLGPIFRYANLFTSYSGATSVQRLAQDFTVAAETDGLDGILLNIDSPGGEANGIGELAGLIRQVVDRGVSVKAYVGGMGTSGAYWLASAAEEIIIASTAMVGSIGVVAAYRDTRERDKKAGVRTIEFVSSQSPRKRPDPAGEDGAADIQAMVDRLAIEFIADVAKNRGTNLETVIEDFGGGALLIGADAVTVGMADRVGTFESILAGWSGGRAATTGGNRVEEMEGKIMTDDTTTEPAAAPALPDITAGYIAADHPKVAEALRAEGATAERDRILGIQAAAFPGQDALVAECIADGTSPGDAALKFNAAEKQAGVRVLEGMRADETAVNAPPPATPPVEDAPVDSSAPVEDRCKAAWDKSPAVRAEFMGNFDRYLAYVRAEEAGQVRRLART